MQVQQNWITDWDSKGDEARCAFAELIDCSPSQVALIPSVSVGVGLIAVTLGNSDEVLVLNDEFTSTLFPLLIAKKYRGTKVVECESFTSLLENISRSTTLIAFSLVQMQSGITAPLQEISNKANAFGAKLLVDATQSLPYFPDTKLLAKADFLVCSAYKHLLCPRGSVFLVFREDRIGEIPPILANWRASDSPYTRFFSGPLTLSKTASMYDISLAWLIWVGTAASLKFLLQKKKRRSSWKTIGFG